MLRSLLMTVVIGAFLGVGFSATAQQAAPHPRFEFTRLVAHWDQYGGEDYLTFIKDAEPDVAQLGFYGAHFWSLAGTPHGKGYPAHFPVQGLAECGQWFQDRNAALHKQNPHLKIVGHFNCKFLVGDPESPEG